MGRIFPQAALVTPNKHETEVLVGYELTRPEGTLVLSLFLLLLLLLGGVGRRSGAREAFCCLDGMEHTHIYVTWLYSGLLT